MKATRLRWKLWTLVSKLPKVCPAHAHSLIIDGYRRNPMQDWMCRDGATRCGSCWCGKIQRIPNDERCIMGSTVSPKEWCRNRSLPGELWCAEHLPEDGTNE